MKRSSREIFLKSVYSRGYKNAFEAFLFSMGSTRQLWQNLCRVDGVGADSEAQRIKNRFYAMSSRLKKEGLISSDLSLTHKGIHFVRSLLNPSRRTNMLPKRLYNHTDDHALILVIFDIPEKLRRYRAWLRDVLHGLGFSMLQKSVWIGEEKLPSKFLRDVYDVKLVHYIQILQISKKGTIEFIMGGKNNVL